MTTLELIIYAAVFAAGLAIYFGTIFLARRFGAGNREAASSAFDALPGFDADDILVYLGSAIACDEARSRIAIWEKAGGARLVDPAGVGSWHSGTLLTLVLNRTTATPMVQLFAGADDDRPFFKVGVVNNSDCETWRRHLAAAFGADRERDADIRVAGV
jgi:hypothetical protein